MAYAPVYYFDFPNQTRFVVGICIGIVGLFSDFLWAIHVRRKYGASHFMGHGSNRFPASLVLRSLCEEVHKYRKAHSSTGWAFSILIQSHQPQIA